MSKITKIENQKNNRERVNIYIDGEYSLSCSLEILLKNSLKPGDEADGEKLKALSEEDNYIKCRSYALSIMERSNKSESELRDKLLKKGYDDAICSKTMEFMKDYGFIDDENLCRSYISRKLKSEGRNRIKGFLNNKGIPEEIVKNGLCLIDEEMEEKTAFNLALKKYNILIRTENDNNKLYRKIGDYLVRRGYSYDICKRVLKKILWEWDDQD